MLWILAAALGGAFAIYTAYPLVYTVKSAMDAGIWVPVGPRVVAYLWALVGPVANLLHNVFVASFIFRDWPRELATSGRIQRYVDQGAGWRYKKAIQWARFMNYCDKGHITGVPD